MVAPRGKPLAENQLPPLMPKNGNVGKYPWDDWFDGRNWVVKHGEDYVLTQKNMINVVRQSARDRKVRVSVRQLRDKTGLVIKRIDGPPYKEKPKRVRTVKGKKAKKPNPTMEARVY